MSSWTGVNLLKPQTLVQEGAKWWHTHTLKLPPPPAAVCRGLVICLPSEDSRTHTCTQQEWRGCAVCEIDQDAADIIYRWTARCNPAVLGFFGGPTEFRHGTINYYYIFQTIIKAVFFPICQPQTRTEHFQPSDFNLYTCCKSGNLTFFHPKIISAATINNEQINSLK